MLIGNNFDQLRLKNNLEELNHEIKCLNVLTTDSQNCSFYDESPHSDEEIVEIISSCYISLQQWTQVLIEKLLKEEPKIFLQNMCVQNINIAIC